MLHKMKKAFPVFDTINYKLSISVTFVLISFLLITVWTECSFAENNSDSAKVRLKCKEVDKLFRRKDCFELGYVVAFVPGQYLCCRNTSDSDLLTIGSSPFGAKVEGTVVAGRAKTATRRCKNASCSMTRTFSVAH